MDHYGMGSQRNNNSVPERILALEEDTMTKCANEDFDFRLNTYRRDKVKMLERHFCITPTDAERDKMKSAKTERAIDRIARKIITDRFGDD